MPPKREIFIFENADKDHLNEKIDNDNLANHQRGSIVIITGKKNSGKSNLAKNLIVNQSPEYDEIIIFAKDEFGKEYEKLNAIIVSNISDLPTIEYLAECKYEKKILILFEDMDFGDKKIFNNDDLVYLSHLIRVTCSHHGLTMYFLCQNFYNIPISFRKNADIFYFFKMDIMTGKHMLKNSGKTADDIGYLIKKYLAKPHDNICIDLIHPIMIRHNIFIPIE